LACRGCCRLARPHWSWLLGVRLELFGRRVLIEIDMLLDGIVIFEKLEDKLTVLFSL
jgi:hypothetical protein